MLSTYGPQPDAAVADWPLTYDELEPWYGYAERAIGVAGTAGVNPFAAWRSSPFPMPSGAPMYGATLSSAAAEKLGYHPYPAPTAANSVPYDGRPACNNCGFCAFLPCAIHAKGDPIALLTRTFATGRAELWPETFVSRIRVQGNRATGVDYIGPDGVERSMDARHVIVAGGAFETPRLLLLSGFDNPLIGQNLMVHYQTLVAGIMPMDLHAERGRAVTHVHDDPMIPDDASMAAAKEAGLPWMRGGMVEHGGSGMAVREAKIYPWGSKHLRMMRDSPMRRHLWAFTMQGEDLPYATNTVDLDPTVRDVRGFPVARITYKGGRHELAASAHHGLRLEAILKEMGATWSTIATSPGASYHGPHATPVPESRHVIGTTRMGEDPATSVVDPFSRVHGVENVIIADSSVFPTSSGYGPTLTLVALAARAAGALGSIGPD
jgi:gluconate 2-dehydrogenase alpha chain